MQVHFQSGTSQGNANPDAMSSQPSRLYKRECKNRRVAAGPSPPTLLSSILMWNLYEVQMIQESLVGAAFFRSISHRGKYTLKTQDRDQCSPGSST